MSAPLTIDEAKQRLRIDDLWEQLDLPGAPAPSCLSPFRSEKRPSFSVKADMLLWYDHAEGKGGDAVDFLRRATGLPLGETIRLFKKMAGKLPVKVSLKSVRPVPTALMTRALPDLPPMRPGSMEEHKTLSTLRHISLEAVKMAESVGVLRFGIWKDRNAWFIVDTANHCAQARRLDGQLWDGIGTKAQTLSGSWASWPICAGRVNTHYICFCEGGPDLLAAFHFIIAQGREADFTPVAMLGASQRIHPEALPMMADKRVRIFAHADDAGRAAARRWRNQLATLRCTVDAVDFSGLRKKDGSPLNDLNDCTQVHPDDAGQLQELLRL